MGCTSSSLAEKSTSAMVAAHPNKDPKVAAAPPVAEMEQAPPPPLSPKKKSSFSVKDASSVAPSVSSNRTNGTSLTTSSKKKKTMTGVHGTSTTSGRNNSQSDNKALVLYSDFTCAYCYLEFLQLKRLMEELPPERRIPLLHGPFQLDATLPNEGVDKYEFLQNFMSKDDLDALMDGLCVRFKTYNLEMNRGGLLGNSAAAHRLMLWAQDESNSGSIDEETCLNLKDELFKIHSCKGKSMGDLDALQRAAKKVGLGDRKSEIAKVISHDRIHANRYQKHLEQQIEEAKEVLDIQAVPALVVMTTTETKQQQRRGLLLGRGGTTQTAKRLIGKSSDIANEEIGFSDLVLAQCSCN